MSRPAAILLAGVFLPSLVLGWLALGTIGEQQFILEKRTAELFQGEADDLARMARGLVESRKVEFAAGVGALLAESSAAAVAEDFSQRAGHLLAGGIPFAIAPSNRIMAPAPSDSPEGREFLAQNSLFLSSLAEEEVFQPSQLALGQREFAQLEREESVAKAGEEMMDRREEELRVEGKAAGSGVVTEAEAPVVGGVQPSGRIVRRRIISDASQYPQRSVQPQKPVPPPEPLAAAPLPATTMPALSNFQAATADAESGVLARFVDNDLQWFFWSRPPEANGYTFGCMVPAPAMHAWFANASLGGPDATGDLAFAILDERAQPAFVSLPGFQAEWKRPFVSAEIGDLLPFWEAAAYLTDPSRLDAAARGATVTLASVIALAIAAIGAAGFFVWSDARKQMALAAKKTDFVGNVSHELKTPLTSIRMFAELLATSAGEDPAKRSRYLRVITHESERLSRLINNVLDFSHIERKSKTYAKRSTDLHAAIARVWEGSQLRLADEGWECAWTADAPPYMAFADEDAICQILVNLISNAEKYAVSGKSLELHTWKENGHLHVAVLDRGPGVPPGQETKIFEAFYRACDSLSHGIQGSGLGLALASRLAADHGGRLSCSARRGGGACFTFTLPLL